MMSIVKFIFLSLVSVPFAGKATLLSIDIHNPTVHREAVFRANGNARSVKMSSYTYLPYK